MQARLELILWNPKNRAGVFLVYLDGRPRGVIALPWMREALYAVYKPWKQKNVERTIAGAFKDHENIAALALDFYDDPKVIRFLQASASKPKKEDYQQAFRLYWKRMVTTTQADDIVRFAVTLASKYDRMLPILRDDLGLEPNEGLKAIAKKFYKERA